MLIANPGFGAVWVTLVSLYNPSTQLTYAACSLYHPIGSFIEIENVYFKVMENGDNCPVVTGSVIGITQQGLDQLGLQQGDEITYTYHHAQTQNFTPGRKN